MSNTLSPKLFALSVMLSVASLAGCSDEPGESDIRSALERNQMFMFALPTMFIDFRNPRADKSGMAKKYLRETQVSIDGCAQAQGAPGYVCDFRLGRIDGQGLSPPMKGRFFKSGGDWQFDKTS